MITKLDILKAKLRSIQSLSDEELLFISTLNTFQKTELIRLYNEIMQYMISYIETTLKDD